jgi:hypothetical protein
MDGGTDAAPEGGPVSTPNKVQCGASSCTTPADYCCQTTNDAGCQPAASNCNAGAKLACDEKADCPGTEICCASAGGGAGISTQCKNDCGGGNVQVCKTNAECKTDAGTCYVNNCPFGPGGSTVVIDACRKIQGCTQ